ncbi:hypothetical protein PVT68_01385 [Microbulbifer bruguierae]|uniref:Uncharacterized protein n=1 Tax=Microbulbifer bruguierae TaxID=3029061 RepID=A0ABY8NDH0_9GAMM|nr:hypothetical protein [Microbulbifer bruguierae]WGL16966.1 hypothetical protein PVT68_01385 [Microbulbifer bruguierae]
MTTPKNVVLILTAFGLFTGLASVYAAPDKKPVNALIINTPEFAVPVIPIEQPPLRPDVLDFQRDYCASFKRGDVLSEDATRRLIEYTAKFDTIFFPEGVYWEGRLLGRFIGPDDNVSIGWGGDIDLITNCGIPEPPASMLRFIPQLDPSTLNLYRIDHNVRDFVCNFSGGYPVDINVRAQVLEFKELQNALPSLTPDGQGQICLDITKILAVP